MMFHQLLCFAHIIQVAAKLQEIITGNFEIGRDKRKKIRLFVVYIFSHALAHKMHLQLFYYVPDI